MIQKRYFARNLPVEGEIKDGDCVFYKDPDPYDDEGNFQDWSGYGTMFWDGECKLWGIDLGFTTTSVDLVNVKKVKLFLCSRDIQAGDIVKAHEANNSYVDVEYIGESPSCGDRCVVKSKGIIMSIHKLAVFKVVGEISPEATWVKEGDEFGETELKWRSKEYSFGGDPIIEYYDFRINIDDSEKTIAILGPCKHFH